MTQRLALWCVWIVTVLLAVSGCRGPAMEGASAWSGESIIRSAPPAPIPQGKPSYFLSHLVIPGDTLASIATDYEIRPQDIHRYNTTIPASGSLPKNVVLTIPCFNR